MLRIMATDSILGDYAKAKRMVDRANSSLHKLSQIVHAPVPSEYLGDVRGAITELLNQELKIYSVELGGVPVAFDEKTARLTENYGTVIAAQPYIHCDIRGDFIVFKPKIGDCLNAVVSKIAPDVISCLVHGCFYATIVKKDENAKRVSRIKVDGKIKLVVTKLEEDQDGLLQIIGKLPEPRKRKNSERSETPVAKAATIDSGIDESHVSGSPVHVTLHKKPSTPKRDIVMLSTPRSDSMQNALVNNEDSAKKMLLYHQFSPLTSSLCDQSESVATAKNVEATSSNDGCDDVDVTALSEKKRKKEAKKKKKHKKEKKKLKKERKERETGDSARLIVPDIRNKVQSKKSKKYKAGATETSDFAASDVGTTTLNEDLLTEDSSTLIGNVNVSKVKSRKKEGVLHSIKPVTTLTDGDVGFPVSKKKKGSKKRKLEASATVTSPHAKRVKQDPVSKSSTDALPTTPNTASHLQQLTSADMSEHQQKALFHLQQLGLNMPLLAMLTSGNSPLANSLGSLGLNGVSPPIQNLTAARQSTERDLNAVANGSLISKPSLEGITRSPSKTNTTLTTVSGVSLQDDTPSHSTKRKKHRKEKKKKKSTKRDAE